ncbi:hypothetical protein ACOTEY_29025 [Achromobacter xylosoxidans]
MAMNGSFAGGLADGLRNGMAISQAWDAMDERERSRQAQKEIAAQLRQGSNLDVQRPGDVGMQPIRVGPNASAGGGMALGDVGGLTPLPTPGREAESGATGPAAVSMPVAEAAGLPSGGEWGRVLQGLPKVDSQAPGNSAEPDSRPGLRDHYGNVADGLMRAYNKALELGELDQAGKLLVEHERYAGKFRDRAYSAARSRYDLTGDPSGFVGFVNQFTPGGIEARSIERMDQAAGGAPMYMFKGYDPINKKEISQPITQRMLDSYVQAIGDPEGQKAMFAKQYQDLQALALARQKAQIDADAKVDVRNRTHSLDMEKTLAGAKGQVVDTPYGVIVVDPQTGQAKPATGVGGAPIMGDKAQAKAKADRTRNEEMVNADSALGGLTDSVDRLKSAAEEIMGSKDLGRITGISGQFPSIPGGGAANLEAKLQNLKSQVGFAVLQAMRDASKTGGALGAISDKENELLQNNLAALNTKQSPEQFKQELQKIVDYAANIRDRANRAYRQTYGREPDLAQAPAAQRGGQEDGAGRATTPAGGYSNLWGQ